MMLLKHASRLCERQSNYLPVLSWVLKLSSLPLISQQTSRIKKKFKITCSKTLKLDFLFKSTTGRELRWLGAATRTECKQFEKFVVLKALFFYFTSGMDASLVLLKSTQKKASETCKKRFLRMTLKRLSVGTCQSTQNSYYRGRKCSKDAAKLVFHCNGSVLFIKSFPFIPSFHNDISHRLFHL